MIPLGAPYLSFWEWVDSSETACYYDVATVWLDATLVDSFGLCAASNTHGWVRRVVNLSAYAGTSVVLKLQVQTDAADSSNLFIDDLAFASGP
jgi:bacillopeptidase F (M6 metalloprotease family)